MNSFKLALFLSFIFIFNSCDNPKQEEIIVAEDPWFFPHFKKVDSLNPILEPTAALRFFDPIMNDSVNWEERNVLNPTAVVRNDTVFLLYRAQDGQGTSRIGLASSTDGLNFYKSETPVFYPLNDSLKTLEWNYRKAADHKPVTTEDASLFDGVEDPRIVESDNGRYYMTYTAYDGKTARLCIASSNDLIHWSKHGLVLKEEKYKDLWSKAGAIIGERIDNKIIAKKIDGSYWMYFGDTSLFMAKSDDLVHWTPLENEENGQLFKVLNPRPGYFDSRLVEPGPYGLYTDKGIVLIYNSSNASNLNDSELPKFTYAAGQALFDKEQPYKLIDRQNEYFIYPDKPYEKIGEVNEVCFVEGLVFYKDEWFLYYGTADSKIAVATYKD